MMGILDGVFGALNAGTQVAAGQQQGEQAGSALLRQIMGHQADMALKGAQTRHVNAQAAEGEYNVANPLARTADQKANEINVLADPHAHAKAAEITATAKPTADAHALDITTTAQPTADAAVLKQGALAPGEVDLTGKKEAAKLPYAIQKLGAASDLSYDKEKRIIPLRAKAAADAYNLKPNDSERGSASFAGPLAQSKAILDRIGSPAMTAQILRKHGTWGNFLISPEGQQFNQAADQFVNAAQFATEGVRFSPEKEKAMRLQMIPNGATDASVVRQMEQARGMIGRTAEIKAGRAKHEVHADVQKALGWGDGQSGMGPQAPPAQTIQQPGTITIDGVTYQKRVP